MPRSGGTSPIQEETAAAAPVPAIASPAVAAEPVTTADERNDEVAVPANGTVGNPAAAAISALDLPELLAPPPPANAPAMAIQAGAAASPNASAIASPGTGTSHAASGRPVSVSAPGADRPAASQRETASAEAFDELASGSTVTPDDLPSAPAAPFSPVPAAHIPAPAPEPAGALPQTQAAPVPLGAVPMTIGLRSLAGSNRFEISLDPKDLGRIDVNLDIDKDSGTVTAHLTVDRPETLALLQRDVGNLQQALSQAGFDGGDAAINLSLRSDTGSNGGNGAERDGGGGRDGRPGTPGSDLKDPRLSNDAVPLRMLRGPGGIDIRI
ncbi:flagellar hook-length control protein FliK [Methylobacterium sp. 10]|uniref:flagellar hook-length control protein FliK n=1 Tax=Methylobacterium sp. 10 TaxID=1101191 RepID=UPI001FD94389|nr:flagellar hook-length control protein FliK [Methylobacterium sp. 10]